MARAKQKAAPKEPYTSRDFFLEDCPSTLFPLATNRVLVDLGADRLLDYGRRLVAGEGSFLPQRRVYANKDALHLRRTVKLDPVAEFYLYDLMFRNRARLRKPRSDGRQHFGYRFADGRPMPASQSYQDFKAKVWSANFYNEEFVSFDISAYFNNVYHHDLHAWFASIGPEDPADLVAFGKFFREINAGRSLDCLPHGLYPSNMIGNDFLRFIENTSAIRCGTIPRFMDDIYLFDDDMDVLLTDFAEIQRLLGLKGLSVNASKTKTGGTPHTDEADGDIGEIKKRLLKKRRQLIVSHYGGGDDEHATGHLVAPLDEEEIAFILSKLDDGRLSEDNAELILVVMRDHVDRIEPASRTVRERVSTPREKLPRPMRRRVRQGEGRVHRPGSRAGGRSHRRIPTVLVRHDAGGVPDGY